MNWFLSNTTLSIVLGVALDFSFILLWLACVIAPLKRVLEDVFTPDCDLFDKQASYAGMVRFLSSVATFVLGALLILPTKVMIDLGLSGAVILVYWWIVWRSSRAIMDASK